ncbi:MAG TPA: hypothetical protein VGB85_08495 [Nannocystis sp.]
MSEPPVIETIADTPPFDPPATTPPPAPAPQDVAAVVVTPAVLEVRVLAYFTGERVPMLHRLADRRLFVSEGPRIAEVPARASATAVKVRIYGGGLGWIGLPRVTPRSYDSPFSGEYLESFGGRWPAALATIAFRAPRTGTVRGVFRRAGSGWRRLADESNTGGTYAAIAPWTEGRVLALRVEDMFSGTGKDFAPGFVVFGAKTPAPALPADFRPYDMDTTAAGDVFVVGARGEARTLWVLRWGPAGGEPLSSDRLPDFRDMPAHESQWFIKAASATQVHVGGGYAVDPAQATWTPYLAALAGGVWTELRTPLVGRVGSMVHAPDGALWVSASAEYANNYHVPGRGDRVYEGGLWRHTQAEGWSSVTLSTHDYHTKREQPLDLGRYMVRAVGVHGDRLCLLASPNAGRVDYAVHRGSMLACAVDAPSAAPIPAPS